LRLPVHRAPACRDLRHDGYVSDYAFTDVRGDLPGTTQKQYSAQEFTVVFHVFQLSKTLEKLK
jgi:hypothetical protein